MAYRTWKAGRITTLSAFTNALVNGVPSWHVPLDELLPHSSISGNAPTGTIGPLSPDC